MRFWLLLPILFCCSVAIGQPRTFDWDAAPGWPEGTQVELEVNGTTTGLYAPDATPTVNVAGNSIHARARAIPPSGYQCGEPLALCPPSDYVTVSTYVPHDPVNVITQFDPYIGAVMAKPIFVGSQSTVFNNNTSPKTTANLSVNTGDVLIAYAITENDGATLTVGSSPSLTWALVQSHTTANNTQLYVWSSVATSTGTISASITKTGNINHLFGGHLEAWRGSDGVGASVKAQASGAPTVDITTTQANSAISVFDGDWSAATGTVTPRTNAGAFTQIDNYADGDRYGTHTGYHDDAGSIGTYAVGYSAPTGQSYSLIAVEIKGQSGAASTSMPIQSAHRFYANLMGH